MITRAWRNALPTGGSFGGQLHLPQHCLRIVVSQYTTPPVVSYRHNRVHLFSSVGTPDAATTEAELKLAEASSRTAASPTTPPPFFPWRQIYGDQTLPRFRPGTPEQKIAYYMSPLPQHLLVNAMLRPTFWQLVTGAWRQQLEQAGAYAFARGVAGILANVYQVPVESSLSSGDFQFSLDPTVTSSEKTDSENTTSEVTTTTTETTDKTTEFCPEVRYMIDAPLRQLFESAHEFGHEKLQIRLDVQPDSARLVSFTGFPFLTRQEYNNDPVLKKAFTFFFAGVDYQDLAQATVSKVQRQIEAGETHLPTTVEMLLLVACSEIFYVLDRETGAVLQGSVPSDGVTRTSVLHLVRFEANFIMSLADRSVRQTDWIITDIDDLLGVPGWYQK